MSEAVDWEQRVDRVIMSVGVYSDPLSRDLYLFLRKALIDAKPQEALEEFKQKLDEVIDYRESEACRKLWAKLTDAAIQARPDLED